MRTPHRLAEALLELARLAELERVARASEGILALDEIADFERQRDSDARDPVAAVEFLVAPPFDVGGDGRRPADLRPRLGAFVTDADFAVILVVAAEHTGLDVFVEPGNEEARLGVPAIESALELEEAGTACRKVDAVVRHVVVEARIEPLREQFRAEAELVVVVVVLAVDVVVIHVSADDDVVPRHEVARAQSGAEEELRIVIPRPAQIAEKRDVSNPCKGNQCVEPRALEVLGEFSASGDRAGREWVVRRCGIFVRDLVSGECRQRRECSECKRDDRRVFHAGA